MKLLVLATVCVASVAGVLTDHSDRIRTVHVHNLPVTTTLYPKESSFRSNDMHVKDPVELATDFVRAYTAEHGIPSTFDFRTVNSYQSSLSKTTHVYFKQTYLGKDVTNGDFAVHVDKSLRIVFTSSSFFLPGPNWNRFRIQSLDNGEMPSVVVDPSSAVDQLLQFLDIQGRDSGVPLKTIHKAEFFQKSILRDLARDADFLVYHVPGARDGLATVSEKFIISTDPVYGLMSVWEVEMEYLNGNHHVLASVANSGRVIFLNDYVHSATTYRAFPLGVGDPLLGNRTLIVEPADSIASPKGWVSPNRNTTIGNNVWAQWNPLGMLDFKPMYRPKAKSKDGELVFDYELDTTQNPSLYVDAAVTNLFFWINQLHDLFHAFGFDEPAGNFQDDNFGRGGDDGDAVIAHAQGTPTLFKLCRRTYSWIDGFDLNYADMLTLPDGRRSRIRMFLWNIIAPGRDGDYDNRIITHEFGHGVSDRLTGGPANVLCMYDLQSGGMGEGWGDFWSLVLNMRPGDTNQTDFVIGKYVFGRNIRHFPYSTSMERNPLTYSWLNRLNYEVHDAGEIWASIMLEVYWRLTDELGFQPDWTQARAELAGDHPAGNFVAMQLSVDALKLQPCHPTFLDARNAMLLADRVTFHGKYQCLLWKGFAKRGLGYDAKQSSGTLFLDGYGVDPACV